MTHSLSPIATAPLRIRRFGISGKALLALIGTAAYVADLDGEGSKLIPIAMPQELQEITSDRSVILVAGNYMIYGNGQDLLVYDTDKRILKTFRLSEWISDHRWVFKDGLFISASLHRIVALPKSEIDAYFR